MAGDSLYAEALKKLDFWLRKTKQDIDVLPSGPQFDETRRQDIVRQVNKVGAEHGAKHFANVKKNLVADFAAKGVTETESYLTKFDQEVEAKLAQINEHAQKKSAKVLAGEK